MSTACMHGEARNEASIVVVGGGVVGICTAMFLAEAGEDVVCIDEARNAGTTANAGSLHVQMQSRFIQLFPELVPAFERALPLYPLAVRHWQALAATLDTEIELTVSGGLMIAESPEQLAFLESKCRRELELGLDVRILTGSLLRDIAPYLGPAIIGAEFCATEGKVNPLLANSAIRRRALRAGVRLQVPCLVEHAEKSRGGFSLVTSNGPFRAGRVVVAAGPGSRRLAAAFGVTMPAFAEPLHMNVTEPTAPLIKHLVQHAGRPITLKQLATGHVVIGGGWPAELSASDHPTVLRSSLVGNLALAQHVIPELGSLRLLRTWAGVNTAIDGRPVLGAATGLADLYFAIPGDAGYTLGPLCARLAADIVLGRSPEIDVSEFGPDRFGSSILMPTMVRPA